MAERGTGCELRGHSVSRLKDEYGIGLGLLTSLMTLGLRVTLHEGKCEIKH
jgi:hypothetical protein